MNRHWVVNASPLIVLAKVSHISLFYRACEKLVIPAGVAQEIDRGPENEIFYRGNDLWKLYFTKYNFQLRVWPNSNPGHERLDRITG